jgi:metallophosphoesterase superfamily enzyme
MQDLAEQLDEGPFRFAHHPEPAPGRYVWAGHLHPTVRLGGGADRLRLPCFHLGREVGVLPAFSAFTGGQDVTRRAGERIYAVAERHVVRV